MGLSKVIHVISVTADLAAKAANGIAAALLFMLMLLTCVDVTLRYLFNKPISGSFELTEFIMAILIALALAFCALNKGHVRVDLVVSRLPDRAQAIMDSIASFAFLFLFILITWRIIPRAQQMMEAGQVTAILRIPVFPFVLAVAVGTTVLCIVLLKVFIDDFYRIFKK